LHRRKELTDQQRREICIPLWRVHPYVKCNEKEGKMTEISIGHDERSRDVGHSRDSLEHFETIRKHWEDRETPKSVSRNAYSYDDAGYEMYQTAVAENRSLTVCYEQSVQVHDKITKEEGLFPGNRIRNILFIFNDSIRRPLKPALMHISDDGRRISRDEDRGGALDRDQRDESDFSRDRPLYELLVFRDIIDSVLRGWQPCTADGCDGNKELDGKEERKQRWKK
jgi:hypothetical protein